MGTLKKSFQLSLHDMLFAVCACARLVTSDVCDLVQVLSVVGILQDEADPMVSVMKVCFMSYAACHLSAVLLSCVSMYRAQIVITW